MNIIFCGLMFSEHSLKDAYKYSKAGIQIAPHVFQTNVINGLRQIDGVKISVMNVLPVGSFPFNYKKLFIKGETWGNDCVQIEYLNIPFIKRKQQFWNLIKEIEKKINYSQMEDNFLVVYHMYGPFLEIARYFKEKYPQIRTCMIGTDCVPGRGDMEKYMTHTAVKKGNRIVKLAKFCDAFVLLTKHLAETLEIGEKPFIVAECICNENQDCCFQNERSENRCLYTGSIDKEFGVCELAEAFAEMDNCELWVCGSGTGEEYVRKMAEKHKNIKFFGFLDQAALLKFRNSCDYLINPRRPTDTYTKYSFPSKTAEYMMSGKPVIMYKLEGIPDEYDQYLIYLTSNTSAGIKKELENIFAQEYEGFREKALSAREFMLKRKSAFVQAERIVKLLNKIRREEI